MSETYGFDDWLAVQVATPIIFLLFGAVCFWLAHRGKRKIVSSPSDLFVQSPDAVQREHTFHRVPIPKKPTTHRYGKLGIRLIGPSWQFVNFYWGAYRFMYWGPRTDGRWSWILYGKTWHLEFERYRRRATK